MKRLFYSTNNLDDAELISDEVHKQGVDDKHFFVLSRDDKGILSHKLHGAHGLENTEILASKKRVGVFAILVFALVAVIGLMAIDITVKNLLLLALVCAIAGAIAVVVSSMACASFDAYFKGVFDEHLDNGEAIVIIDVTHDQSSKVVEQLKTHPAATFIAESSNLDSPIPS